MGQFSPILAPGVLRTAIQEMDNRKATYDAKSSLGERSMAKTVEVFQVYTGHALSEEQGWLFMNCLKTVRSLQGNFKLDNYVDDAAYCALRGEAAAKERGNDETDK